MQPISGIVQVLTEDQKHCFLKLCHSVPEVPLYATYVTVGRKHVHNEFIHIHTVIFSAVGQPSLSCWSLQVSAHIAHHSKALLKVNLELILSLLYPYVAEAVDGEKDSFFMYKQR